jgi:hypothetical protein
VLLVGVGALAGFGIRSMNASHPAPKTSAKATTAIAMIEMSQATGRACQPPAPPGPGHPDPVLTQIFNVQSGSHTPYLLGWQIVPYRGSGTYTFGAAGNILALQPPAGGHSLGFGTGTITVAGTSQSGSISARVKLVAGGTLSVEGNWECTADA